MAVSGSKQAQAGMELTAIWVIGAFGFDENSLFSPTNNSLAIRADVPGEDERVNRTLEWAFGKL